MYKVHQAGGSQCETSSSKSQKIISQCNILISGTTDTFIPASYICRLVD